MACMIVNVRIMPYTTTKSTLHFCSTVAANTERNAKKAITHVVIERKHLTLLATQLRCSRKIIPSLSLERRSSVPPAIIDMNNF